MTLFEFIPEVMCNVCVRVKFTDQPLYIYCKLRPPATNLTIYIQRESISGINMLFIILLQGCQKSVYYLIVYIIN